VKSALALVCDVRLNGSITWEDYNVFAAMFHTTAEASCCVKKLAKLFTTMFHLVCSFVLIMIQCPPSGLSALIGYGGRCTARIVSQETKKSSPMIIACNVFFKTTGEWLAFPFFTSFYGSDGTKFFKNLDDEQANHQLKLSHAQRLERKYPCDSRFTGWQFPEGSYFL
jgi:hypothetical protein